MSTQKPLFVIPLILPFKKEILPSQFRLFASILENGYLFPGMFLVAISHGLSSKWSFLSPGTYIFLQTLTRALNSIKNIPFKTHFIYDAENEVEILDILSRKGFSISTINHILEEKDKPAKIDKIINKAETILFRFSHLINDLLSSFSDHMKIKSKEDFHHILQLLSNRENLIITTNADLLVGSIALLLKTSGESKNFLPNCKIVDLRSMAYHINLATTGEPSIKPLDETILSPLTLPLYERIKYKNLLENTHEKQNYLNIIKETYESLMKQLSSFKNETCFFCQNKTSALPSLKKAILFHSKIILSTIANLRKEGIPINRPAFFKIALSLFEKKEDESSIKTYYILKDILAWTFNSHKVYPCYDFLTKTGRIIMKHPAIFRLPKNFKHLVPLTEMDYSQVEVRIFAGLFRKEKLIKLFQSSHDFYQAIANRLNFASRDEAKVAVLKSLYGGNLPHNIQSCINSLFEMDKIKKFFQSISLNHPYILVSTISGRLRKLTNNFFPHFINTIIQGSTSDLIFARLYQLFKSNPEITINMIIQDAIYTTIKDDQTLEIIKTFMEKLNEVNFMHGKCNSVFSIKIVKQTF